MGFPRILQRGLVEVTAEGFAGPFAYQVIAADSGDSMSLWLDEKGFELGDAASTLDLYIDEGGYSFVAVTLTPDDAETPEGGRKLPALAIQSDSQQLSYPARMSITSSAEQQHTILYVLGDTTAETISGWESGFVNWINIEDDDATGAYEEELLLYASNVPPSYIIPYTGEYEGQWVTRFETLAPRAVHTADPVFEFLEGPMDPISAN